MLREIECLFDLFSLDEALNGEDLRSDIRHGLYRLEHLHKFVRPFQVEGGDQYQKLKVIHQDPNENRQVVFLFKSPV